MNNTTPIKKIDDMENFKNYYLEVKPNRRNHLMIILGLNTALRISDILSLKWSDVYNFKRNDFKSHILIKEQKTQKMSEILINDALLEELRIYQDYWITKNGELSPDGYLFCHRYYNKPISRVQAHRILKEVVDYYDISGRIACHSLRKTFGYQAWKQGVPTVLLVAIFNHSSFQITKRYLGIEQDERDDIFRNIKM